MDQLTPSRPAPTPDPSGRGRTTRQAAVWATAVALPIALLSGLVAFFQLRPTNPATTTRPSASPPAPQSTTPVALPAPALSARQAVACRALINALPATIRDLRRRPITAGAKQNAAYGDPAITVRCGVPTPDWKPPADPYVINGVCWLPVESKTKVTLTTVDRETPVMVTVPKAYPEAFQWIVPIADATMATIRSASGGVPPTCRPVGGAGGATG